MYANYFGLHQLPFEDRADASFYFATPACEEALAAMQYAASDSKAATLILGETGTGKTTLIRTFLTQVDQSEQVVVVTCPPGGSIELVRETCKFFGVTLPTSPDEEAVLARLKRHLKAHRSDDHRAILVLDQAENLTEEGIDQLAAIANLTDNEERLLTLIVVAAPALKSQLAHERFEQLSQRLYGERSLSRLSESQTRDYIAHRLRVAGVGSKAIFEHAATSLIHNVTKGIPRIINNICNECMLAAYGAGSMTVSQELVAELAKEHGFIEPEAAGTIIAAQTAHAALESLTPAKHASASVDNEVGIATEAEFAAVGEASMEQSADTGTSVPPRQPRSMGVVGEGTVSHAQEAGSPTNGGSYSQVDPLSPWHPQLNSAGNYSATDIEIALERLDRAIAHADRISQSQEGVLAEYNAVDKHLSMITEHAGRIAQRLSATIEETSQVRSRFEQEFQDLFDSNEARAEALRSSTAESGQLLDRFEKQLDRLESAFREARDIETNLTGYAKKLAYQGEDVQERVAQLMQSLEVEGGNRQRIDKATQQAEKIEEKIKESESRLERLFDNVNLLTERTVHATEQCDQQHTRHQKLQESVAHLEKRCANAGAEIDSAANRADRTLREVQEACGRVDAARSAVTGMLVEANTATEDIDTYKTMLDSIKQDIDRMIALNETGTQLHDDLHEITRQAEPTRVFLQSSEAQDILARWEAVHQTAVKAEALSEQLRISIETAEPVTVQLTNLLQNNDELVELAESGDRALRQLDRSIDLANQLDEHLGNSLEDAHSEIEQIEMASQRAADVVERIDDRTQQAGLVLQHADAKLGDLETASGWAEKSAMTLGEEVAHADRLEGALSRSQDDAKLIHALLKDLQRVVVADADRLDKVSRNASETVESLANLNASGREILKRSEVIKELAAKTREIATGIEQSVEQGDEVRTDLKAQTRDAALLVERIGKRQVEADRAAQRLQESLALTEKTTQELGAQRTEQESSTQKALQDINTATAQARKLAASSLSELRQTAEQSKENTERNVAELETMIRDVWSLAQRSETLANQLGEHASAAPDFIEKLESLQTSSRDVIETLSQVHSEAAQHSTQIQQSNEQARKLAEQVKGITTAIQAAQGVESAVRRTVESAAESQDSLGTIVETAQKQYQALTAQSADLAQLLEGTGQWKKETAEAQKQIRDQMESFWDAAQTSEKLIEEFTTQAQYLNDRLADIRGQADRLHGRIDEGLSKPHEILAAAQAQAGELQRVSDAIRKVFAGVSKQALEATKQTNDFKRASDEANRELSELVAERDRTTTTLREWVEEAIRVQNRLERAIEQAPSVRDTHPGNQVRRLSEAKTAILGTEFAEPHSAQANEPVEATSEIGSRPATVVKAVSQRASQVEQSSRPEEIARMIEEARRASAPSKDEVAHIPASIK